jgi:hypothetical protein
VTTRCNGMIRIIHDDMATLVRLRTTSDSELNMLFPGVSFCLQFVQALAFIFKS